MFTLMNEYLFIFPLEIFLTVIINIILPILFINLIIKNVKKQSFYPFPALYFQSWILLNKNTDFNPLSLIYLLLFSLPYQRSY